VPWVKLTDDWYDDPKVAAAGALGLAMWVVGLSWCARNLTDGNIPRSQARKLIDLDEVTIGSENVRADDVASRLVSLGLWRNSPDGYAVENYHRYQPARDKVLADRELDRQRKASRRHPNGIRPEPPPESDESPPGFDALPSPVPDSDPGSRRLVTHESDDDPVDDDELSTGPTNDNHVPDAVWDAFAELRLRQQPAGSVRSPSGFKRTAKRNAKAELAEQAALWWAMFDITPRRLAEALADGTAPRGVPRREPS